MFCNIYRLAGRAAAVAAVGALAACVNPAKLPPDSPLADVSAQIGQPNFSCPMAGGGQRVIWTQQPYGQFAWGAHVGPDGRVDQVVPVLTDANFKRLATGTWTAEQVRCEFGPPADISQVGLPSVREVVWSYRYKQSGVWNSLMYVYLGREGDRVTRFHPGPDPMYDEDWRWR
ncbi:hypothetical protein [Bordetella petrii]|uniref:hypothetical protein n=1 Tax=Bordetella petrii TaxID=94624 RepID=UPI001E596F70|nr:hypothetical protein [Bordetella petrii]MCD0501495.1 hypothetical protein [Bordetella petrii]